MSECKRTFWQKVRGLFVKYKYNRTVEKYERLRKELYELTCKKSDYWLS